MASKTTWRNYADAGGGVHFPFGEPTTIEKARISMLGEMDDRRKRYISRKSRMGLFRLAAEYGRLGMVNTAAIVKAEAKGL